MGLTTMKNLSLYLNDFPPMRQPNSKLLDPVWWTTALSSNKKFNRIFLKLEMNGVPNALNGEVVQQFRSLPFFIQLNVKVAYTIKTEYKSRLLNYQIKSDPCNIS